MRSSERLRAERRRLHATGKGIAGVSLSDIFVEGECDDLIEFMNMNGFATHSST
jgi:hypothetical protein